MEVRPLGDEADVREVTVAHGRAWRAAYEGLLPPSLIDRVAVDDPSDERVRSEYERLGDYGEGRVFVAEDEAGTVRGYSVFRWGENETKDSVREGEAELKELYVDPDRWGEGYGTALLEAGLRRLPDDVDSIALETLEGNEVAARFYEARGFEPDGTTSFEIDGERYPTRVYRRSLG
jgi:ribosomal protein S18 acetylase RimI-like enzyme